MLNRFASWLVWLAIAVLIITVIFRIFRVAYLGNIEKYLPGE